MEFQPNYFQILKDDAVKVLHLICQQIWNTHQWPRDWKRSVFKSQRKAMPKNAQTTTLASKVMLKILQVRLQQYVNFQLVHLEVHSSCTVEALAWRILSITLLACEMSAIVR